MENRKLFSTLLAVLLALPAASSGQTFRGGISGTVTDPSGAALPGALVTRMLVGRVSWSMFLPCPGWDTSML
jgi:hypothetical protein